MNRAEGTPAGASRSRLRLLRSVYLLSAPLLVGGFILLELTPATEPQTAGALVLVSLIGQIVLGLVLIVAEGVLRHYSFANSWWSIVAILAIGSILRAFSLVWGLELLNVPDTVPLVIRVANSLALIPVTFVLGLRGMEFLEQYVERRRYFISLLLRADQQLSRQVAPFDPIETELMSSAERDLSEVNDNLARALTDMKDRLRPGLGKGMNLGTLRDQADSQWRELSHRMWENARRNIPRMSPKELIDTVAQLRPLSLVYLAIGGALLFVLALVRIFPLTQALVWALGWFTVMVLCSLVLNEIPRRLPQPGIVFVVLFVPYALGGAVFLFAPGVPLGGGWGAAGVHFTVAASMVLIGAGPAVSQSQQEILAALRRQLDARSIRRLNVENELSILTQKFAERLHADIRGSFHAAMMRIQKSIDEGKIEDARVELELLIDSLRQERPPLGAPVTMQDVQDFLRHWDGLVTISSNLADDLVPPHLIEPVASIVMNAVNDAIRHGNAQSISVVFDRGDDIATLTVINDGRAGEPTGPDGLGHQTLERFAGGRWKRKVLGDGLTELAATFPLASSS